MLWLVTKQDIETGVCGAAKVLILGAGSFQFLLVPELSVTRHHWEKAGLPGVLTHPRAQVRPLLRFKFLA